MEINGIAKLDYQRESLIYLSSKFRRMPGMVVAQPTSARRIAASWAASKASSYSRSSARIHCLHRIVQSMLSPMCKPVMWTKQKPLHSFKHMSHTFAFLSVHLKHRRIVRGQNGLKNIEKYSIAEDTYSWQLTAPNQDRGSQRTYGLLISTYHTATDQNPCTLVNIQIAGTWMFICKTKNAEKENIGLDNSHPIPFHPSNLRVNCPDCHFGRWSLIL
jgi:hypothetical protein